MTMELTTLKTCGCNIHTECYCKEWYPESTIVEEENYQPTEEEIMELTEETIEEPTKTLEEMAKEWEKIPIIQKETKKTIPTTVEYLLTKNGWIKQ